jgi:ribonuclease HI
MTEKQQAFDPADTVTIYTDGACKGNPGPGGWGAIISRGDKRRELHGGERDTTNNRMELTAAIEALKALNRPLPVRLHTDSQYVQKGISEWIHNWKARGWKTADKKPVKNADLWEELDRLNGIHRVEWVWVRGHAGDAGNELADTLANRAIDRLLS